MQCPVTGRKKGWKPHEIDKALEFLEGVDLAVGHNIIDYDFPAIEKLFPNFKRPPVFDTLLLSRMLEPDRLQHGLDSYGKQFGNLKGDYGKQDNAWDKYTDEMFVYCEQDVDLTNDVYHHLCRVGNFDPANPLFKED